MAYSNCAGNLVFIGATHCPWLNRSGAKGDHHETSRHGIYLVCHPLFWNLGCWPRHRRIYDGQWRKEPYSRISSWVRSRRRIRQEIWNGGIGCGPRRSSPGYRHGPPAWNEAETSRQLKQEAKVLRTRTKTRCQSLLTSCCLSIARYVMKQSTVLEVDCRPFRMRC